MKKVLLVIAALGVVLALAVLGYAAYLLRSIDTPAFKQRVLAQAEAFVGTDVQVREMEISVLSGVSLEGITLANPAPFAGPFLTADALVLRYRLRPLLDRRLEVERLAVEEPLVNLAMDARGDFNYEKLGAASSSPRGKGVGGLAAPIVLDLQRLEIDSAAVVMRDHTRALLMKLEGGDLDASFRLAAGGARGTGRARIATLNLADAMFVRELSSPVRISRKSITLSPIAGKLAGGDVTGEIEADLQRGFRYTARLQVKGADVEGLLAEARSTGTLKGTLAGQGSFAGSGGLPTLTGNGRAEVADCRVESARALSLLATLLQVPDLARPDFDQCSAEFRLAGSRVHTPVLKLLGAQIQLTGSGTLDLETSALDYDLTLALARPLFNKITRPELRGAFRDRGDGFSALDFELGGTTLAPRTDLLARVGGAAVEDAVRKGLERLFGRKKQQQ